MRKIEKIFMLGLIMPSLCYAQTTNQPVDSSKQVDSFSTYTVSNNEIKCAPNPTQANGTAAWIPYGNYGSESEQAYQQAVTYCKQNTPTPNSGTTLPNSN